MAPAETGDWAEGLDIEHVRAQRPQSPTPSAPDLEVSPNTWLMEFSKKESEALEDFAANMRNASSKEDAVRLILKAARLSLDREVLLKPMNQVEIGVEVRLWQ